MKRGDVWLVEFPSRGGNEQEGTRPAIILAEIGPRLAIVIPCTSNEYTLRFPATMKIIHSKRNGLHTDSVALISQLGACEKQKLVKRLGELEEVPLREIKSTIKALLDL